MNKGNYPHFMLKEIHEQPEVVGQTLAHYVDMTAGRVALPLKLPFDFNVIERILITACGTASYAGQIAKCWFEGLARVPVEVDVASEFRYREAPLRKGTSRSSFLSQGRPPTRWPHCATPRARGCTRSPSSTWQRRRLHASRSVLPTLAGPEIGVASTKAFTCQLMVMAALAVAAGKERGELSEIDECKLVRELIEVPRLIAAALAVEPQIEKLARDIAGSSDVLYLGRGTSVPLALEGALKLKKSPISTQRDMPPESSSMVRLH